MDSRLIVCVGGVIDSVWVKGILFLSRRNPPSFYFHPQIVPQHPQPILSVRIVPMSCSSMQRPKSALNINLVNSPNDPKKHTRQCRN
jgi:hypothetical protein